MSQKAATKDELFLLKLYQMALALGGAFEEVDRFAIGKAIGQNDRGVNTMVRHLAQANFIKQGEGQAIYLTKNGVALAEKIKLER